MKSSFALAALMVLAVSVPALAQSSEGANRYDYGRASDGERLREGRAVRAEAPPGDKADLTPNTNYNDILKNGH